MMDSAPKGRVVLLHLFLLLALHPPPPVCPPLSLCLRCPHPFPLAFTHPVPLTPPHPLTIQLSHNFECLFPAFVAVVDPSPNSRPLPSHPHTPTPQILSLTQHLDRLFARLNRCRYVNTPTPHSLPSHPSRRPPARNNPTPPYPPTHPALSPSLCPFLWPPSLAPK